MPENQEVIWRELARIAGVCDATKLNLMNLLFVSRMALRWVHMAQQMYAVAESERMIEKLDSAAMEIRRQVFFSVLALGIGTAINAALLLRAGASVAPVVRGGVQLWTSAGPARTLTIAGSASWVYAAQNPLYAAGYTLTQLIAAAVPSTMILTAARIDSDPAGPRRHIMESMRYDGVRDAYNDYELALLTTLRRGFRIGSSQAERVIGVIRMAAANGTLNDVRLRIDDDLDRLARDNRSLTPAQQQMAKLGAKVDLWLQVHTWCDARVAAAVADYLSHLRSMERSMQQSPHIPAQELERIREEIRQTQSPSLRYAATAR